MNVCTGAPEGKEIFPALLRSNDPLNPTTRGLLFEIRRRFRDNWQNCRCHVVISVIWQIVHVLEDSVCELRPADHRHGPGAQGYSLITYGRPFFTSKPNEGITAYLPIYVPGMYHNEMQHLITRDSCPPTRKGNIVSLQDSILRFVRDVMVGGEVGWGSGRGGGVWVYRVAQS